MGEEHDSWLGALGIYLPALIGSNQPGQALATPPNPQGGGSAQPVAGGATPPATGGDGSAQPSSDAGNYAQGVADRLAQKIKAGGDLKFDIAMLTNMDMPTLLDVMDRLKRAGALDEFPTSDRPRIGAAILTVQGDFEAQWAKLVDRLSAADQKAIFARVPAKVLTDFGYDEPNPDDAPKKPGDPKVEPGGVVAVNPGDPKKSHRIVAEVQAKLTFHSDLTGNLGETEFTIHIGDDGKPTQLEADVTAIKIPEIEKKIAGMGALGSMLQLDATLSFNTTVDLDRNAGKIIFGQVQAQAKLELEAHFKSKKIPGLEKIAFKLTATGGTDGFNLTGGIEIPIGD